MSERNVIIGESSQVMQEQPNPLLREAFESRTVRGFGQVFGQGEEFSTATPSEVQAQVEEMAAREQGLVEQEAMVQPKGGIFSKIPEISPAAAVIIGSIAGGVLSGLPYVAYEIGKDVINLFSKKEEEKKEEEKKEDKKEKEEEKKPEEKIIVIKPEVSPIISNIFSPEQRISSSVQLRPYIRRKARHQGKKKK